MGTVNCWRHNITARDHMHHFHSFYYINHLFTNILHCLYLKTWQMHRVILESREIETRWGRDFPHSSRPALGPTQPPVQWVPGLSWGKTAGTWHRPPIPSSVGVKERVKLIPLPPSGPSWPVTGWTKKYYYYYYYYRYHCLSKLSTVVLKSCYRMLSYFIESESSSPCSQKPASWFYPTSINSSPEITISWLPDSF